MTAAQLIARAEAALRTNQPNLATLYMNRGIQRAIWEGDRHFFGAYHARRKLPRGGVA